MKIIKTANLVLNILLLLHAIFFLLIGWYGYAFLFLAILAVRGYPSSKPPQGN